MKNTTIKNSQNPLISILNVLAAIILIIGNSSYTIISKGQSIDSLRPTVLHEQSVNDNIKLPTISMPTKKMIRKADNEISRNMMDLINLINNIQIVGLDSRYADQEIRNQFFEPLFIILKPRIDFIDQAIGNRFNAENIQFTDHNAIIRADEDMNQDFITSINLFPIDIDTISEADDDMNMNFLRENP